MRLLSALKGAWEGSALLQMTLYVTKDEIGEWIFNSTEPGCGVDHFRFLSDASCTWESKSRMQDGLSPEEWSDVLAFNRYKVAPLAPIESVEDFMRRALRR